MGILASLKLFAIVGILAAGGFALNKVTNLKAELAVADANVQTLNAAATQQAAVIESMQADIEMKAELAKSMQLIIDAQREDYANLNQRFQRSANGNPRDIGNLAVARAKSVERVINAASKKATRCIELASGSLLTEEELKIESKNTECQGLLDTLRNASR